MRHYKELSDLNFCIEQGFYPLGSCTMKYNPKVNELLASLDGFNIHPNVSDDMAQGALKLMYNLQSSLLKSPEWMQLHSNHLLAHTVK